MKKKWTICRDEIGGAAPERFRIFPAGEIRIEDGDPVQFDEISAALVLEAFGQIEHDMVIDYEHQTLSGDIAPAAGWITALEWIEGDGLWASATWTEKAAEMIAAREYRYISPVMYSDRGRVVGLYNVAVTNQPRMQNVSALAAKDEIKNKGKKTMFEELCKLLGIDQEGQTEEGVLKALKDRLEAPPPVASDAVLEALELKNDATEAAIIAKLDTIRRPAEKAKGLEGEVIALKDQIAGLQAQRLIDEAVSTGRITPDELKRWGNDLAKTPDQFRAIVMSRQPGAAVPLSGSGPKPMAGDPKPKDGGLDEAQLAINKMLGVSAEAWKQYGPGKEVD